MGDRKLFADIHKMITSPDCGVTVSRYVLSSLEKGTISQQSLRRILPDLRSAGCGQASTVDPRIDPKDSTRLSSILTMHFTVLRVSNDHDNAFSAVTQGIYAMKYHKLISNEALLRGAIRNLRKECATSMLDGQMRKIYTTAAQTMPLAMFDKYIETFLAVGGYKGTFTPEKYVIEIQKMARGSYPEFAVLAHSKLLKMEIHVYRRITKRDGKKTFKYVTRFQGKPTSRTRVHVLRLLQTGDHFDVLLPRGHGLTDIWKRIDERFYGKRTLRILGTADDARRHLLNSSGATTPANEPETLPSRRNVSSESARRREFERFNENNHDTQNRQNRISQRQPNVKIPRQPGRTPSRSRNGTNNQNDPLRRTPSRGSGRGANNANGNESEYENANENMNSRGSR